ncbi:MAG TPA: DEAD/DEAH box helicase, partial [Phaeodactylibacter sp.]|nr:DEAD/DEAH box helicase [Phaeodactylibacter sp.]
LDELGFERPTPVQAQSYSVVRSGKNIVGIAQTGTGKTFAYLLPILNDLKFSKQMAPRVAILVPTRELVLQVVEEIEKLTKYINLRVIPVYGGTNINTQAQVVAQGADIVVGTPGRFYDLALRRAFSLKSVRQLVIDEVDVMLDLGFRFQLTNIFDLLPERRQNIMFSATMTEEVDDLIQDFFYQPAKISIAVSGTPLDNIAQSSYPVPNFYTKANLLAQLLQDKDSYHKVLVFVASKKNADRLFARLEETYGQEMCIIHSNKSQNYRIRSIEQFNTGKNRILIATDVMARGLDLHKVSHVINMDTPVFPENYMHRIGRTGRAEEEGKSILFFTEKEQAAKRAIEELMNYEIPLLPFPEEVEISTDLLPEERTPKGRQKDPNRNIRKKKGEKKGAAFHEKKAKNQKENISKAFGGKYRRELKKKYKKPQKRGDKIQNRAKKKRKKR